MGLAVPTALGVALAQPDRRVVAITGDGEMMMGLGSLAVVGDQAPANLAILVLDNEAFGETGRQRGLTAGRTDIAAVAKGFGIAKTMTVTEQGKVGELAELLFETPGPVLAVAKIAISEDPWALPEKDGAPSRSASGRRLGWRRLEGGSEMTSSGRWVGSSAKRRTQRTRADSVDSVLGHPLSLDPNLRSCWRPGWNDRADDPGRGPA